MLTIVPVSAILFLSCRNEDCFTPPEPVLFEFVNSADENLLQNGIIDISKIVVQENAGNSNFTKVNLTETAEKKVRLNNVGWFDGTKNYSVILILPNEIKQFDFAVNSTKINADCATYSTNEINFTNINTTKINNYSYKIIVN